MTTSKKYALDVKSGLVEAGLLLLIQVCREHKPENAWQGRNYN